MNYALVTNAGVERRIVPSAARKLVDGEPVGDWVLNLNQADAATLEECGFFELVDDEKPELKSNQYLEPQLILRYERPVVEWVEKTKPLDDQIEDTIQALVDKDVEAAPDLITGLDTYLSKEVPSIGETRDAVAALARIVKLLAKDSPYA